MFNNRTLHGYDCTYSLLGQARDSHVQEVVVVVAVGDVIFLFVAFQDLLRLSRGLGLGDLGEGPEVSPAQLCYDVNLLTTGHHELLGDDHLDEPCLVRESVEFKLECIRHVILALLVERESLGVEILDDLLSRLILLDLAVEVKAEHVARVNLGRQFEELDEPLSFGFLHVLLAERHHEVDVHVVVVLLVVLYMTAVSFAVRIRGKLNMPSRDRRPSRQSWPQAQPCSSGSTCG